MDDRYREIPGHPGYRVSREGEVQSCWAKTVPPRVSDAWHTLKPIPRGKGYPTVNLGGGPRKVARLIHQLVLEAFVGPRPPGLVCCHSDGDRTNNRMDNLRWDSYLANSEDMLRHGTRLMGSRANAKLTEEQVMDIRRLRAQCTSVRELADRYGVTTQNIEAVVYRRTWRHVP
jgi:HNH endonuclease